MDRVGGACVRVASGGKKGGRSSGRRWLASEDRSRGRGGDAQPLVNACKRKNYSFKMYLRMSKYKLKNFLACAKHKPEAWTTPLTPPPTPSSLTFKVKSWSDVMSAEAANWALTESNVLDTRD